MTLSAILIAGGRSRRMGVDKATLLVEGGPLWQRQIRVLGELQPQVLQVSARETPAWCPSGIEAILDGPSSRGPLSGVAAGLSRLQTSHLLVLAVDLPQMTGEHLRKLWSMAQPGTGVIPSQGDYFEPLCAIYPAEASTVAEEALKSGDASLQRFVQILAGQSRVKVYHLPPDERLLYRNMNTPADLPAGGEAAS